MKKSPQPLTADRLPSGIDAFKVEVYVEYPKVGPNAGDRPTWFIPSDEGQYLTFEAELKQRPNVIAVDGNSVDYAGVMHATFEWKPDCGMDIIAFAAWAQEELKRIMLKHMAPYRKEAPWFAPWVKPEPEAE